MYDFALSNLLAPRQPAPQPPQPDSVLIGGLLELVACVLLALSLLLVIDGPIQPSPDIVTVALP